MQDDKKKRNIALLVLGTGVLMFALMMIFVLPYFMSEKKYGEMQAALNEGDYSKVLKIANYLLNQKPSSVQAFYFRGQAFLAQKKYLAAERDLERALKVNQQYSNMRSVSVQLGEIYHKHGLTLISSQPDKAYRLFLKALKHLPREISLKRDLATASYNLGRNFEIKDNRRAIGFYRQAVKYDPDNSEYKLALGKNLIDSSPEEAVSWITDAFKKDENLKTQENINLLTVGLWRLVTAKERDFYEGKISDTKAVTTLLDNILSFDENDKDTLLEKFAFAINTGNNAAAEGALQDITNKGLPLPIDDLNILLQKGNSLQPQILFNGENQTGTELKLDSELAWSAEGSKILVKGMDKGSSETKMLVFDTASGSNNTVTSAEKISWAGRIFTPATDGVVVLSQNSLYKINNEFSGLEKASETSQKVFDISRDGQVALTGSGSRLHKFNFVNDKSLSINTGKIHGKILEAVFSPQNKRIAIMAGNNNTEKLGVLLGKNRSKVLAGGGFTHLRWSWDGKKIYYLNWQGGINSVYGVSVDEKTDPQALTKPELNATMFEPSPVDDYILYKGTAGKETLWLADEMGNLKTLTPRYGQMGSFVWSPDGSKVAYLFCPVKGGPVSLEVIDVSRI